MINLALANAVIVITITQTAIFKSFRECLPSTRFINIRKLFHCAFCLSWWTSPLFILMLPGNFIINWLVMIAYTSLFSWFLLLYLKELDK